MNEPGPEVGPACCAAVRSLTLPPQEAALLAAQSAALSDPAVLAMLLQLIDATASPGKTDPLVGDSTELQILREVGLARKGPPARVDGEAVARLSALLSRTPDQARPVSLLRS